MVILILLAFALTCATVAIHAIGTLEGIAHLTHAWRQKAPAPSRFASEIQIVRVISVLLFLHLLEASVWASFYWLAGVVPNLETAIYFSLTSYTTVGYGDVVLPTPWRVLGPIEAGVGILMFGWSTAILVAAITKIHGERLRQRSHEGDQ